MHRSSADDAARRPPAAAGPSDPACGPMDLACARRLLALLRDDDVDGAIEAGLASFQPVAGLPDADNARLIGARDGLLAAWAARDRYRAREARLQRIADERRRAREARSPDAAGACAGSASPSPTAADGGREHASGDPGAEARPALPPAAAAALARARARAAGRTP